MSGDDIPDIILVVLHRPQHDTDGHHHLGPGLGEPGHTGPVVPPAVLVQQDVEGIFESYQG